ncbi:MAG: hypothetical protein V4474_00280 [Patescibacteria group bacterium]
MEEKPVTLQQDGFEWALVREIGLDEDRVSYVRVPLNTPDADIERVTGTDVPLAVRYYFACGLLDGNEPPYLLRT